MNCAARRRRSHRPAGGRGECRRTGKRRRDCGGARAIGLVPEWNLSCRDQCRVRNSYEQAGQLGADRWAALIGARAPHRGPVVVVMAGTATTVDLLDETGVSRRPDLPRLRPDARLARPQHGPAALCGWLLCRAAQTHRRCDFQWLPACPGGRSGAPVRTVRDHPAAKCLVGEAGAERCFSAPCRCPGSSSPIWSCTGWRGSDSSRVKAPAERFGLEFGPTMMIESAAQRAGSCLRET